MLRTLRKQEFKLQEERYKFDSRGDLNLGYDVTMWRSDRGDIDVHDVVAEYHPQDNSFTHSNHSVNHLQDLRVGPHSAALMSSVKTENHSHVRQCLFTGNIQRVEADLSSSKILYFSFNIQYSMSFLKSNRLCRIQ